MTLASVARPDLDPPERYHKEMEKLIEKAAREAKQNDKEFLELNCGKLAQRLGYTQDRLRRNGYPYYFLDQFPDCVSWSSHMPMKIQIDGFLERLEEKREQEEKEK